MGTICNNDCFNCIYTDCIIDGLGRKEGPSAKPKKSNRAAVRMRAWYEKNKEQKKAEIKGILLAEQRGNKCQKAEKIQRAPSNPRKALDDKGY